MNYYTDQWAAIHARIFALHLTAPSQVKSLLDELRYGRNWLPYILQGRGHGTTPKPPFKAFRGSMYKYNIKTAGARHVKLFTEKGTNACDICEKTNGNATSLTPLDYFTFYPTGEIFSWLDPVWVSGMLQVDPRQHDQPADSPLTVKWICKKCYGRFHVRAFERFNDDERRWNAYPSRIKADDRNRVLVDRRVHGSRWAVDPALPDRRVAQRRGSFVTTRPEALVTECNT